MIKRTNIEIDTSKLIKAKRILGLKTTSDTVNFALDRIVKSTKVMSELLKIGQIEFEKNYNYKTRR